MNLRDAIPIVMVALLQIAAPAWASELAGTCAPDISNSVLNLKQQNSLLGLHTVLVEEYTTRVPGVRNLDEVREYILQATSARVARGFDRVRMEIEFAALAFNIPPAFLACLVYQESKFDPGALSQVGASGLLQLTDAGRSEIQNVIKLGGRKRAPPTHAEIFENWKEFHRLKATKNRATPSFTTGSAVADGSLLLSYYLSRMRNPDAAVTTDDLLVAAGAYNLGITKSARTCGSKTGYACRALLAQTNRETRIHMTRIDDCMHRPVSVPKMSRFLY